MRNKLLIIILNIFVIIVFFIGINTFITTPNDVKNTVFKIESNYKGVIIKKYKVRNTAGPTNLDIIIENGKKLEIIPTKEVMQYASVGDSIIKPPNENIVYIKKTTGESREFYYTKISKDDRYHSKFPIQWRKKWPESSEWDKK